MWDLIDLAKSQYSMILLVLLLQLTTPSIAAKKDVYMNNTMATTVLEMLLKFFMTQALFPWNISLVQPFRQMLQKFDAEILIGHISYKQRADIYHCYEMRYEVQYINVAIYIIFVNWVYSACTLSIEVKHMCVHTCMYYQFSPQWSRGSCSTRQEMPWSCTHKACNSYCFNLVSKWHQALKNLFPATVGWHCITTEFSVSWFILYTLFK